MRSPDPGERPMQAARSRGQVRLAGGASEDLVMAFVDLLMVGFLLLGYISLILSSLGWA